jgi:hypothetical protein
MDYDYGQPPAPSKTLEKLKFGAGVVALLSIPFLIFQAVILPFKLLFGLKLLGIGKVLLGGMVLHHSLSKKSKGDHSSSGIAPFSLYSPFYLPSLPSATFNANIAVTDTTTAATTTAATTTSRTTTTTTTPRTPINAFLKMTTPLSVDIVENNAEYIDVDNKDDNVSDSDESEEDDYSLQGALQTLVF